MKTISKINRILSLTMVVSMLVTTLPAYATWDMGQGNSYTFGPEGRPLENIDQAAYGKPSEMVSIVPGRPIAARDKDGNHLYYSPDGSLSLQITKDGRMSFSLTAISKTKSYDDKGKFQGESEFIAGTNKSVTRNDKGQVISSQEYGFGGQVVREYSLAVVDKNGKYVTAEKVIAKAIAKSDSNAPATNAADNDTLNKMNLSKEHMFNEYGKSTRMIVDALTQTKTVFGAAGGGNKPLKDINYEGAVVATYKYDSDDKLDHKVDLYGNLTFFDKDSNITYTENNAGQKLADYVYKSKDKDAKENSPKVLEKVITYATAGLAGEITYFDNNGKAQFTKTEKGDILKDYKYDSITGTTLLYVFDHKNQETIWYDISGKEIYSSIDGAQTKQWLYSQGKLMGVYDVAQNTVDVYRFGQQDAKIKLSGDAVPTGDDIQKWYDENGNKPLGQSDALKNN